MPYYLFAPEQKQKNIKIIEGIFVKRFSAMTLMVSQAKTAVLNG
jgi:hypothetical protein